MVSPPVPSWPVRRARVKGRRGWLVLDPLCAGGPYHGPAEGCLCRHFANAALAQLYAERRARVDQLAADLDQLRIGDAP